MTCCLLINRRYEKARSISTTVWQEIVVVLHFGLEKIESFSTLIHKKHKILCLWPMRLGYANISTDIC